MKNLLRGALAATLLSLPVVALPGDCSTLSVGTSSDGTRTTVTFDVTGSTPLSYQVLVVGQTAGPFSINLGTATLDLGIVPPFLALPLGTTDLSGDVSVTVDAPAGLGDYFGQAVGVTVIGGLGFCASGTAAFTL